MKFWYLLDNPLIWELSRIGLDFTFGLYQKRIKIMQEWGLLDPPPSILDIGCGIGQYANVTEGNYLGVDLNERYINHARKRAHRSNQVFRCADVTTLLDESAIFDLVLMVDFLHHLPDHHCTRLLNVASHLAQNFVISFEPITYQPHPLGNWIVENDRGSFVRSLENHHRLFIKAGLTIVESIELRLGPINTQAVLARTCEAQPGVEASSL